MIRFLYHLYFLNYKILRKQLDFVLERVMKRTRRNSLKMNHSSEKENQKIILVSKISIDISKYSYIIYEDGMKKKKDEEEGNHYNDSEYEYEYVDGYQDATEPASSQDSGK